VVFLREPLKRSGTGCLWALLVLLAGSGDQAAAKSADDAVSAARAANLEIRDWFALGSGCRAIPDQGGDVRYELIPDPNVPNRYAAVLHFDSFALRGDQPISEGEPSFARECGIRFGIYPAAGFKLRRAQARYTFTVERDPAAKVRLRGRLFLGKDDLERAEVWLDHDDPASASRQFDLAPAPGRDPFANLRCEEAKIVGLDISAATMRDRSDMPVLAKLKNDRAVVVFDVTPCASAAASQ
jgi:hypothetical protein